jgi:hypothetical protein
MARICSIIKVEFAGVVLIDHTHTMEFEPVLNEFSRGIQEVRALSADGISNIVKGNARTVYTFSRVKEHANIYAANTELTAFPETFPATEGLATITAYSGPNGDMTSATYIQLANAAITSCTGKLRRGRYSAHTITIRGGDYTTV